MTLAISNGNKFNVFIDTEAVQQSTKKSIPNEYTSY